MRVKSKIIFSIQVRDHFGERAHWINIDSRYQGGLVCVFVWYEKLLKSFVARHDGNGEYAANGTQMPVKREFSRKELSRGIELNLLGGQEEAECKREIEACTFLFELRWGERDDDLFIAALRGFKTVVAAIFYGRGHSILCLLHSFVGKTYHGECVEATRDIAFHRNELGRGEGCLRPEETRETRLYLLFHERQHIAKAPSWLLVQRSLKNSHIKKLSVQFKPQTGQSWN